MTNSTKFVSVITALALAFMPSAGYCLPQGEQVVEGSAIFDRSTPDTLNVNQSTDKLIANYDGFSIGQPETVRFIQPSSSSIALNRVVGVDPSIIMGTLTANGRIFLINPNGVTFGPGSKVDTMGLVASTLNLSNDDFMAGRYSFFGSGGSVVNQGYISAPGGYVALMGSAVENSGVIEAELGSIALAAGSATTLKLDPKGMISVVVDGSVLSNTSGKDSAVKNSGTLKAGGGKVILTAKALDGVFKNAVNTQGIVEADSIDALTGEIVISADQRVSVGGTVSAQGGKVTVDSQGADYTGLIKAAQGVFNANGGDTFISGDLTGGGTYSFSDELNIYVNGLTFLDNADLILTADSNASGDGNLFIDSDIYVTNGDVSLKGWNINISGSVVSATKGSGTVSLELEAGNDVTVTGSDIGTIMNGAGTAVTSISAGNNVFIEDDGEVTSSVSATVNDGGTAEVTVEAGKTSSESFSELSAVNSDIIAQVRGEGETAVGLYNGNGSVSLEGCNVESLISNGDNTAMIDVVSENGDINIIDSGLYAEVDDEGAAAIYLNAPKGGVNIMAADITAWVGSEGTAGVYMFDYNKTHLVDLPFLGSIDIGGALAGDINITDGSYILAQASHSIEGNSGHVYMNTNGNINISSSDILAGEYFGTAAITMLAGKDIYIDENASLTSMSNSYLSSIIGYAGGSIYSSGYLDAVNRDDFGLVSLIAQNDLYVANSYSYGGGDLVSYFEDAINNDLFGFDTQYIDIGNKYNYGGLGLFSSSSGDIYLGNIRADGVVATAFGDTGEYGSIFSEGTVTSHYLGLGAYGGIGTFDAPINMDVDIVSAFSYGLGDVNLYQTNASRLVELGLYLPTTLYNLDESGEGKVWLPYEDLIELGASVAANDGIVRVVSEGSMKVNSIISRNGGVFLEAKNGNIYTGHGWNPLASQESVDSAGNLAEKIVRMFYETDDWDEVEGGLSGFFSDMFSDILMDASHMDLPGSGEVNYYLSPVMLDFPLDKGANVWASGYSYFSTPKGTIGVDAPAGIMAGAVKGISRPAVSQTVDGNSVYPAVGFDLVPESGYVMYQDQDSDPVQIWPDVSGEGLTFGNPLEVNIQVVPGSRSAAHVRPDFTPQAGLTLNYSALPPVPPPGPEPGPEPLDMNSQIAAPLTKYLRAYYEILSGHRFVSVEPATPMTFFGYRPLTPTNMKAFEDVDLDIGAYDFISDNIKPKKPLAPFYGQ